MNSVRSTTLLLLAIFLSLLTMLPGCTKNVKTTESETTAAEPAIPAHYTTYTDEIGLFSISYPPDWDSLASYLSDIKTYQDKILEANNSDLPVDKVMYLFAAGLPSDYSTSLAIAIEPMPSTVSTVDQIVEVEVNGIKEIVQNYREFSRIKTTVDGKKAVIIDWEGTYAEVGKRHNLQMYIKIGQNAWLVGCNTSPEESNKWQDDFQSIVRSLRIFR
jgi:hypothetical protein